MTLSRYKLRAASLLGAAFAMLILASAIALADDLMAYREDYRDIAVVPATPVQTEYRVGHGYITDSELAAMEAADSQVWSARGEDAARGGETP